MRCLLALAVFALTTQAQKSGTGKVVASPPTSVPVGKGKASVAAGAPVAVGTSVQGDNTKESLVDLVLQSLAHNFTAVCNAASRDYLTCADGYVKLDCKFTQSAASIGGVNCIPYLDQCPGELLKYCQSKVPKAEKCKSTDACACSQEAGCGWSRGHMMCLVNRDQVSCGDCPTMDRCGKIDCPSATNPCDCAALGGQCGWSTGEWRCEAGKDTDCNECAEQTECGGPGLVMKYQEKCPATMPLQLSPCSDILTCPYDKKCCPRCGNQKQVCAETQAECDGQNWELRTLPLVCVECEDYYYDDVFGADAPSEPLDFVASQITQSTAIVSWKAPKENFKAGIDGYSVAYAAENAKELQILDIVTVARVSLTGLLADTVYKLSILPIVNATGIVGMPGLFQLKTLPAAAIGKRNVVAKAGKAGKTGKSTATVVGKAKAGR